MIVRFTAFALPLGGTHSMRCAPALSSIPARGVTPRETPSTDTEHEPGLDTMCSRPIPLPGVLAGAVRVATGSESTEMTGTSLDAVGAASEVAAPLSAAAPE